MNGKSIAMSRSRRRFSGDRAGAAEIIGDILLVAMSVIMVSALALQLSTVPSPQDSVRADLVASYDGENITVLHMGGEALVQHNTRFQVFTNDTYTRYANITDGKSGTTWQVGENWTLAFHTNPTQRVRIQVIDTKNSAVMLDQVLQRGPDASMVPDLGLLPGDISLLFSGHEFNDTNGPMADDNITVNVTVHNYGPAPAYNFTVRVSDYSTLDRRSYPVMAQNISLNGTSSTTLTTVYWIPSGSWGMHTLSVRVVPLPNETRFANNYASTDYRVGYTVIASHPGNPVLRIRSIESYPRFPVHGAYVNLTSRISNQGGVPGNATVRYYLGSVSAPNLIGVESGLGVPVGGESLSTIVWRTPRGGTHNVIVNVTDPTGTTDQAVLVVEVLPTILLVDDDRAGEGGLRDVGASMREALNSVAASYTLHTVLGGGDGPAFDSGERPLRDYDLVIWVTGYEPGTTLSANDQTQLGRYLDAKGRLWLVGQDVLSGLGKTNAFLNTYMKVNPATPNGWLNIGLTPDVIGSGPMSGINLSLGLPFPTGLADRSDTMMPLATALAAWNESGGGNPYAILFNATTNGTPTDDTYKTCLFGFEPSRIRTANERSIMTFEMLRWFEVGATWGRDLAVSDQRFSKTTPAFMETINVTVFLRNNGQGDEPTDISRPQLQVGFYVDGAVFDPVSVVIESSGGNTTFDPPTSEFWLPQDTGNATLKVPASGGFVKVTMAWVADRIGQHVVAGVVDPYDYIQELNENNNEVSSAASKTVYVRYGTLVVDDDGSPNNGGGSYPATENLTAALEMLGYSYDRFNTTGAGDGPGIAKMELYNAIIWSSGESGNALTAADQTNLAAFLGKGDGRYLWLAGPRSVPNGDYTGAASFFRDYLRVGRVDNPVGQRTPAYIEGAYLDPVAHGTRYPSTATYSDAAHKLVPYVDGLGMFFQKPMATTDTPNEVAYSDGADGTTTGWYARLVQVGTSSTISNVYDPARGGVIQLARTGAHLNDNFFLVGDFSLTNDQNPSSLPWKEDQRAVARWSFRSSISYTFIWHLTDTVGAKHTLTYTSSDVNNLAADPVMHGLGAWTADGAWHTVTRDLLADLREGAGNGGLSIREVDGFEVAINTGTVRVDDVTLSRPFMAIRQDNITNNYRTVFTAWDPSFISYAGNNEYCAELVYQVMGWFNMYDERPELRITHLDLFHTSLTPLRDMKPMMGESYMLKARVWNPGGNRGDAVVRFSDGNTVIESVSVSVEHDSFIIAEVIWTPLYAGSRTISAWIDPDNLLEEIFKFNNRAQQVLKVYFFYDDMENGPGKWDHTATIARLNGESTLEYMDPGPVSSDVLGEWSEWNGWKNTTDNATLANLTSQYHSQSKAFYMHEPQATTRTPVDVVLTMDATGSMEWETPCKAEGVKSAMLQFVNRMKPSDRGAISAFTTSYPFNSAPNPPLIPWYNRLYTPLTSDKGLLADGIVNITVDGGTPFWNSVVVSFTYIKNYGDTTRVRCMVILTDGDSNSDVPNGAAAMATALATVRTAQIPVFVIGYGAAIHLTVIETLMINLAAEANLSGGGGGWYYYSPGPSDIANVFANISKQIEEMSQTLGRGGAPAGPASPPATSPARASPRIVLFSDNMETGAGAWTIRDQAQAGTTWRRVSSEYQGSGTWSWRCRDGGNSYANNNDDWLVSPTFDALGYHDLKLGFWHRPAMRRSGGFDAGFVFLSNDNGATWVGIQCFSNDLQGNGAANPATVSGVSLDALAPTSQMKVAFRMWSDGGSAGQGWSVDDVTVTGTLGYGRSDEGAASPQATVTILQEGFEVEPPVGWSITNANPADSYWHRDTTWAHTDSYAYRCYKDGDNNYKKNDDDTLISPTFDLSGGYTSPLLTFWHRTDVKVGDWCYAEISNNNGGTWTTVWQSNTENNSWASVLGLDLTVSGTVPLTNQMKLRFRFVANNDNNVDTGWSVDDVWITAVTPPAGGPPETFTSYWNDGDETPRDKYLTTPTFNLVGVSSAKLTFWHKYNLKVGGNGGVLMVGNATSAAGPYTYRYITPSQPYPNNLKIADWGSGHLKDGYGTDMRWCWNGISGAGKFTWDFVQADLSAYAGQQYVRVRFQYLFCGGGTGFGWAIDDVEIRVHRSDSVAVTTASSDQWELVQEGQTYGDDYADGRFAYSGRYSWWNHNPKAGIDTLKGGIDNALTTIPIDLSRAKDARLDARLRFNILYPEGRPPDGFRVEVSSDLGISWRQINMGVRSAWNVSGCETAGPDGTSYTGVNIVDNWVSSGTVTRLNCDLSGWAGSVIQVRFRVVTRNDTINHHQDLGPGFGGFYIDDVTVTGNTTTGQGRSAPSVPAGQESPADPAPPGASPDGDRQGDREPAGRSPAGAGQLLVPDRITIKGKSPMISEERRGCGRSDR